MERGNPARELCHQGLQGLQAQASLSGGTSCGKMCCSFCFSVISYSSGILTPRSKQGVREGCCQLRTVLMKPSSAWCLPWVDISSAVTSHVSVFGGSVLWDSPASPRTCFLSASLRFLFCEQGCCISYLQGSTRLEAVWAPTTCHHPWHTVATQ